MKRILLSILVIGILLLSACTTPATAPETKSSPITPTTPTPSTLQQSEFETKRRIPMSEVFYDGKIDGEFEGFNDEVLFKMKNGTYWVQAKYKYWYHYAYCPDVTITKENATYIMTVAGHSIPVRRVQDVIESRIDGEFKGWDGKTSYKLQNGQVWQQSTYKYEYKYAYMPEAVVYEGGSGYKMCVAGTTADVKRIR